jgi:phage-related baseplate assembly protein
MAARLGLSILTLWLAAAVGGCGADPIPPAGPAGTVHGTILLTGGPSGTSPAPAAGTIVVTRDGDEVTRQRMAEGQEFSFALVPGRYRLTAKGVDGACEPVRVTVAAGTDHTVAVTCRRE